MLNITSARTGSSSPLNFTATTARRFLICQPSPETKKNLKNTSALTNTHYLKWILAEASDDSAMYYYCFSNLSGILAISTNIEMIVR